jgi:hypothetical protein
VKAKIVASSYADPVTFPPTTKFSIEQTNLTSTYNNDLALLQGSSIPAMSQAPAAQNMATVQQQQQPVQVVQQPVYTTPQPIQLPQQQIVQQPILPQNYIAPVTQPTGVVAGTVSTAVPQPVQPIIQSTVVAPAISPIATPHATRKVLDQPDLWSYTTQQQAIHQVRALG